MNFYVGIIDMNWFEQHRNKQVDERYCRTFIKPTINQALGILRVDQAKRMIDSSTLIHIFGMSLWEIDATWWEYIGKWLLKNQDCHRVIYAYVRDFNPLHPEIRLDAEDLITQSFLTYLEASEDVKKRLRAVFM